MGRFREKMNNEFSEDIITDENYKIAYKKVKIIKGFYSHLKVYLIVNVFIIISNLNRDFIGNGFHESGLFEWHTYSTALFWGFGLLAHGLIVFSGDLFFSDKWQQKKVQEFMDKESANNKWE
ncbi:hypothetical protein GON26_16825 [Flavobacterium sp. GA093]|uniref:2TM domain-containing protein n=1 Tax=Flavobacterium hydrocarbonoxydans TaxID=2683249 RepID=A0A6I4NPL9_9FLAO|nr:2TM domain-containing protein [Flavobacterium hydrocarbonoxydans]MWB96031.1 hypothetical protein [Flavobacterium hydrocarbonoxydans]